MANYTEEQIERAIWRLLAQRTELTGRIACPDEQGLAGYLSGTLTDLERGKLEDHLNHCSFCLGEVAAVNQAMQEVNEEKAPRWLMERAMGLVRPSLKENVVHLAVRLVKDAVELVSGAGEWMVTSTPQLVAVRGAAAGAAGVVEVEREIGGYKVAVDVEYVETGICQVVITLTSADGKPADGIRVSLVAGEREQASFLTRRGQAVFAGVSKGEYNLVISQALTTVGTISLNIEAES